MPTNQSFECNDLVLIEPPIAEMMVKAKEEPQHIELQMPPMVTPRILYESLRRPGACWRPQGSVKQYPSDPNDCFYDSMPNCMTCSIIPVGYSPEFCIHGNHIYPVEAWGHTRDPVVRGVWIDRPNWGPNGCRFVMEYSPRFVPEGPKSEPKYKSKIAVAPSPSTPQGDGGQFVAMFVNDTTMSSTITVTSSTTVV